jgi:excinuclease ABC subunit C
MRKAAAAQEYEKAAELRDALTDLRRTTRKTEKFERIPYKLPVALDPQRDLAELGRALGLPAPPERIEGFDISNISGTFAVASMVSFKHGRPDRANYRRFKIKTVTGQDDFACMAETIHRRYARLLREQSGVTRSGGGDEDPEAARAIVEELRTLMERPAEQPRQAGPIGPAIPDLILIDGGKGQLNAACAELAKLGLERVPVIGLAKEFEEIFRPGEAEPLRLSHDSGALKLLQRVRDESHRVANSYNAQLRIRRISESVLDEFPGIGEQRKAALLKKFGSVQRLRTASVEELAEVPGFGGKAAAELKAFLEARSALPKRTDEPGAP